MQIFFKDRKKLEKALSVLAIAFIAMFLAGGSYYLGFARGSEQTKHIVVEGVLNPADKTPIDFTTFWEAWSVLKSKFVSKDKVNDNQNLLYGAISGMVSSLGDPHTVFFPPKEAESFSQEISGQFGGIGAEIGLDDKGELVVIAPLKDTPAYRAGIQAGDRILKIGDADTAGMTPDEAVQKIRGERGTKVTLLIQHKGDKERSVELMRDIIQVPTIDFKRLDRNGNENPKGDIAYIKLYNFYEQSPALFQQAAVKSIASGSKAVIIDLRNNPGGYLDAAVNIGGWFVKKGGLIVKEEFQDQSKTQEFESDGPALLKDKPVAVLINRGSASASEILAGALKEDNGAILLGEKSFGKGTVQELVPLSNDAMIKVTIAHWLTPQGHQIDKNGIMPDVELKYETSTQESSYGDEIDSWVRSAVSEISKKITQ
jgi:carboxyl-terminal processing protease